MSKNTSDILNFSKETLGMEFYACVLVCNIGFVANIFNILICLRKNIRKTTLGFYNILMSLFSILTLIFFGYLLFFNQSIGREELINTSSFNCIFIPFFCRVFAQTNNWINVMVTFDRMLCIYKIGSRFNFINNKKILSLIVLAIMIVIGFLNVPSFFFYLKTETKFMPETNTTQVIDVICHSTARITLIRDVIGVLLRIILPLVLEVFMNTVLIYKLYLLHKVISISTDFLDEYRFTISIVILNITFIIGEMPNIVATVLINLYGYNQNYITMSSNEAARASFSYIFSMVISAIFCYTPLLFINLATNKIFQSEVKKILRFRDK